MPWEHEFVSEGFQCEVTKNLKIIDEFLETFETL